MNRDPIGEKGGANLYAFVDCSPVSAFDVLGLYRKHAKECQILIFYGEGAPIVAALRSGEIKADVCSATAGSHCESMKTMLAGSSPSVPKFPNPLPRAYYTDREVEWYLGGYGANTPALKVGADVADSAGSPVPGTNGLPRKSAAYLLARNIWAARSYAYKLCKAPCCCPRVKIFLVKTDLGRPSYSDETLDCRSMTWSGLNDDIPARFAPPPSGFWRLP